MPPVIAHGIPLATTVEMEAVKRAKMTLRRVMKGAIADLHPAARARESADVQLQVSMLG